MTDRILSGVPLKSASGGEISKVSQCNYICYREWIQVLKLEAQRLKAGGSGGCRMATSDAGRGVRGRYVPKLLASIDLVVTFLFSWICCESNEILQILEQNIISTYI
jgi:hypothetical protein